MTHYIHYTTPCLIKHGLLPAGNAIAKAVGYRIRLPADGVPSPLGATPLAFLLGLTDTLQDWGRPKFRALSDAAHPGLGDHDISIEVEHGQIHLRLRIDDNYINPTAASESGYNKARGALIAFLQENAIDYLQKETKISSFFLERIQNPLR